MTTAVQNKQQAFERIAAHQSALRQFGAARLGLFGSFVRGEQTDQSDVDVVVDFEPGKKKLHNLLDLADYLEAIMARRVDLLTWEGMAGFVQKHVENEIEYCSLID
jgi:uncharacterized protein